VCSKILKVGMVTIYPRPLLTHGRNGGVASYSKNLINSLLKYCSVIVFAEKLSNCNSLYYDNVPVHRCWTKDLRYPFQIFRSILQNQVDLVHIQHETYLFGGLITALAFPLLLALIKLLRKPVIVTVHAVVPLSEITGLFLKENRIPSNALIMRFGLAFLIKLIVALSTKIIVHERNLMDILIREYNCDCSKITVINHGIEQSEVAISSDEAKRKLGVHSKKVILFFGYITGYKNVGLLIESAQFLKIDNWLILIAGGMHPRLADDRNYIAYISELQEKAAKISEKSILFKGFVREEDFDLYFSAADLVILPYNISISSSGPLSLATSYGTPFLVSNAFREVIPFSDIQFMNDPQELAGKIDCFFENPELKNKILAWVDESRMGRSWNNVAEKTFMLYTALLNT
jgi:glycosyltransferase involved in cell wall biosynthesis